MSPIPFRFGRLQPDLIANANQLSQRLDVHSSFPKKRLQIATAHFIDLLCSFEKSAGRASETIRPYAIVSARGFQFVTGASA